MKPLGVLRIEPEVGSNEARNPLLGIWPVAGMTRLVVSLRPSLSSSSKEEPSLGKPLGEMTARVPVIRLSGQSECLEDWIFANLLYSKL